jgi:hypothetical protein
VPYLSPARYDVRRVLTVFDFRSKFKPKSSKYGHLQIVMAEDARECLSFTFYSSHK